MNINKYKTHIDIILGVIVLYGVLFNYSELINAITMNYHPVWSDEFFYFINTYSFIQNDTLEAALTFGGEGSVVFGADAHGIGYPLLHGTIAGFFDWSNISLISFNFIIILISILLVWFIQSITITHKLWFTIIVLLFPFFPLYAFTYMQEVIHIFIALVISVLIYHIYNKDDNKLYIVLFILTIFISGIFRSLWFFWLIGLIPVSKSKRQLITYSLLFFFGVILSLVFTKLFTEPVPNYFSSIITLFNNGEIGNIFISLFSHFFENIKFYFFGREGDLVYKSMKYINFGTVAYFTFKAVKYKSKLTISLALIGILNFLLLFLLYDAFGWREIRTMSPLFYFYILFLVKETKSIVRYVQVGGLCFLFFFTIKISNQWITERNNIDLHNVNREQKAYKEISEKIPNKKTILLDYIPRDYSRDLLNLPLRNINNSPIRYIIQYYDVEKYDYDYILTRPKTDRQNFKIIDNDYFKIFKNGHQAEFDPQTSERELTEKLSVDEYLRLSLLHYKKKDYFKSIEASKKVISLDPNSNIAYNNLCSAYNKLSMYDEAKTACERSLLIKPQMQLAQNNLKASLIGTDRRKNRKLTPKEYLNLSYNYYKLGYFDKCIEVSKELLDLEPNNVVAYNNICSSYNALKQYRSAIKACEKALEIDPNYQLAKNNLKWSESKLNP